MVARKAIGWSVVAVGLVMAGCKTPADIAEEQEVRSQTIESRTVTPRTISPGELAAGPQSKFGDQTVTTVGNIASFFNAHAFTLKTANPGQLLLVLLPSEVALPPGKTSAQVHSINERVQISGQVKTYEAPQMVPGLYDIVPATNRGVFDRQPVLVASNVKYLDLPYTAVGVSPSGVQVAPGNPGSTPSPTSETVQSTVTATTLPEIREVKTIVTSTRPIELVGRKVTLNRAVVVEVPSDKTFWVDGGAGRRFLCIVDEVNKGGHPQEQQMRIRVGDRLNLSGVMMRSDPNQLPTRDPLTAKDKEALRSVQVYVWVQRLSEKYL